MFWLVVAGAAWVVAALGWAMLSDLLFPNDAPPSRRWP